MSLIQSVDWFDMKRPRASRGATRAARRYDPCPLSGFVFGFALALNCRGGEVVLGTASLPLHSSIFLKVTA